MTPYADLRREDFRATIDGTPTDLFTLRNRRGMVVRITNYGCKIVQILAPDRDGALGDVVQGYETLEQTMAGQPSMGSFIGRYCGRIGGGRFTLDGVEHRTAVNAPPNTLHGGQRGSRFRTFNARPLDETSLELTHVFEDGEEGFPGTLPVRLVYTLDEDNALTIAWTAVAADKATVANFTDHSFFNLSGDAGSSILDHVATVNGGRYLALDATAVPTGELVNVTGTPLDFRSPTAFGARIGADGAAMLEVAQDAQRVADDLMRLDALDVGDEADAAGVLFARQVVQTFGRRTPSVLRTGGFDSRVRRQRIGNHNFALALRPAHLRPLHPGRGYTIQHRRTSNARGTLRATARALRATICVFRPRCPYRPTDNQVPRATSIVSRDAANPVPGYHRK